MADGVRSSLRSLARFALRPEYREERVHEWRRERGGEPPLPPAPLERVLVLCHGNICRSPFAEVLLQARCAELEVRSAGLAAGDGNLADPIAIDVAREWRLDLLPHRSRLLTAEQLEWAQLVLVMTAAQAAEVGARGPAGTAPRVRLLGDYLPGAPFAIDDPFGRPAEVFRDCFRRIDLATERLSARLRSPAR